MKLVQNGALHYTVHIGAVILSGLSFLAAQGPSFVGFLPVGDQHAAENIIGIAALIVGLFSHSVSGPQGPVALAAQAPQVPKGP